MQNGQALIGFLAGLPVFSALGDIFGRIGSRGTDRVSAPPGAMVLYAPGPARQPAGLRERGYDVARQRRGAVLEIGIKKRLAENDRPGKNIAPPFGAAKHTLSTRTRQSCDPDRPG